MKNENPASQGIVILRWVVFFPAALLAGWLAWFLIAFLNRVTMVLFGIQPDSFLPRVSTEFISHAVMGAIFVFVGAKVAPLHRKTTAYALAGLGMIASGFMLFAAIMVANYWGVWSSISLILGVGITAYSVSTCESELGT